MSRLIDTIMNIPVLVKNASDIISLHQYLDTPDWNFDGLKKILVQNPSSINEGGTPLIKALESKNCTIEIIDLLLYHGADVNLKDSSDFLPLMSALQWCRDEKIIEMLLNKGARVDINSIFGESPLCVAINHGSSKHVFKLLLDAGCSVRACRSHVSAMHCLFTNFKLCSGMRADIIKLLIEAGAEFSKLDALGRSLMCYALYSGARPCDIELLIQVGVSLNACKFHSSAFHCLVGERFENTLEADVVKTLLDSGARFDSVVENSITLLQHILGRCKYDSEAFRLLLNVSGVDVNDGYQFDQTLLHCAVNSRICRLSTVKLLLDKGAKVDKVNFHGETALDVAIQRCVMLDIIKLLLKEGSPINTQHHITSKQLMLAVNFANRPKVLLTLLIAGARMGMTQNFVVLSTAIAPAWKCTIHPLFKDAHNLRLPGQGQTGLNCIKYLVKCYGLEYPAFDIEDLIQHRSIRDELQGFAEESKFELQRMESVNVGHGRTLHQLISRQSSPCTIAACCMMEGKDFDFNQLLETLSVNAFPLYFDIISANVGEKSILKKLQEVLVHTVKRSPDSPRTDKKVILCYDIVIMIACYLSDADLLRLILAFYRPMNHATSKRCNEEQVVVGPAPSNFPKRPKMSKNKEHDVAM